MAWDSVVQCCCFPEDGIVADPTDSLIPPEHGLFEVSDSFSFFRTKPIHFEAIEVLVAEWFVGGRIGISDGSQGVPLSLIFHGQSQRDSACSEGMIPPEVLHHLREAHFIFSAKPVCHLPEHFVTQCIEVITWARWSLVVATPSSDELGQA